ncbi:histidine kinase [Chitinophaga polysaccharea]|uniref:Histidine kinase n=1 Tax=Chitinophaga polysaccharea TaxID=1293035 RepID=A0A561Q3Y9_9BACT|nr:MULTISPECIES: histidine kinase [Chitinophaga]NLR61583.1 histidine kinase [Chitinophaga polysaccharea]NLU93822.1 histidine kinase [Chitinophaga sp. Ak27]TWF45084.1 histidine kinase [Chitinophaga polysaccharea]
MLKKISKYWWCQMLGWSAYFALNWFYYYTLDKSVVQLSDFINLLIFIALGILATHLFRTLINKRNWVTYNSERQILLFFAMVAGTSVTVYISYNSLMYFVYKYKQEDLVRALISPFVISFIWWMIYYIWHYIERNRSSQVDQLKLETTVKELELKTIKAQLNPHFIFNALNSIRALVDENPQRARTAITELSNILRSSMQSEKAETVSLENELNIVKDYLALEHIRFEERLNVQYDIDPDTLELQVPPMMLQTLVENAIKHGISRIISGGSVYINSSLKGMQHVITIENTGQIIENSINGHGFGLQSTRQRLGLLFGSRASFEIRNKDEHTVEATVVMPLL